MGDGPGWKRLGLVGAGALLLAGCGFGLTGEATDLTYRSATLTGTASSTELPDTVIHWFQWGLTTDYGQSTDAQVVELTEAIPVEAVVDGLLPDTTYHYRLCVSDMQGHGACGFDETLQTAPADWVFGELQYQPAPFFTIGVYVDARSDPDGSNVSGVVGIELTGSEPVWGEVTCIRFDGGRATVGFDSFVEGAPDGLLTVEQAGTDGRSRFDVAFVDPSAGCPAPPTGTFGFLSTAGGAQVVDR